MARSGRDCARVHRTTYRGTPVVAACREDGFAIRLGGMSLCVLGMAEEFKGKVAVNALWPRTTISTAAVNMLGGDALILHYSHNSSTRSGSYQPAWRRRSTTGLGRYASLRLSNPAIVFVIG